jgi:hypothetical protein
MRALRDTGPLLALTALLVLLGLGTHGCSSGTAGNLSTQSTLGPAGGAVTLQGIQLLLPAGALSADVNVVLRASISSKLVRISIEPNQLALARPATLSVTFQGAVHIVSVDELSGGSQWPLGVVSRVETASGSLVQLQLDHFAQLEVDVDDGTSDAGNPVGCCGPGGCDVLEGGGHGGGKGGFGGDGDGGQDCDGGVGREDGGLDDNYTGRDAGLKILLDCPSGFECDDGVCVAPGGNDEEKACNPDGGMPTVCPVASHCEERRCLPDFDGGVQLGSSCDEDGGMPTVCPTASHCEERRCLPDLLDGGLHLAGAD